MQVSEIMSPSVELTDPNVQVRDAAVRMRDEDLGALPVGENDRLIGMVTDRDIVTRGVAAGRAGSPMAVREVMSEKVYYCFDDEPIERVGELMAEHKVRRVPVINRDKRLVGVVGLGDLARGGEEGLEVAKSALIGITEPTPHAPRA